MKRLIICCDGTWNRPDQLSDGVAAPPNVAKLALAVAEKDAEGNRQCLHYQPGVGTRRREKLLGGGLGVGLSRNVQECYRFLVDHYEPNDELYLFGFSRGAFTARSTVGLIRNAGILRREHRHRIEEAYKLYRDPDKDKAPKGIAAELFRRSYSHDPIYVHFIGVWDTVGALGIPIDGFRPPVLSKRWTFHDTKLSSYVRNAYHAIAIDERRKPFRPTLWERGKDDDQPLEQVWFAGVHCDVGGGYADPSLSEIPLLWMIDKASACDLSFRPERLVLKSPSTEVDAPRRAGIEIRPDARGKVHESRTGFYRALPAYDRRLAGEKGAVVDGGRLASSARLRHDEDEKYRPAGVDDWIRAGGTETVVRPP